MIKIAICDDEFIFSRKIYSLTKSILSDLNLVFSTDLFFAGEELCEKLKLGYTYDIIFLDIRMNGISGVEVGNRLRKHFENKETILIYISSYDNRAKEVFHFNTHRFLSKPIDEELFQEALFSACERLKGPKEKIFSFKDCGDGPTKLILNHIFYFEVTRNHRVDIIAAKKTYTFYGKLTDISIELESDDFIRIHQSYLINYDFIDSIAYKEVLMKNGMALPISGPRRKIVRKEYMDINQRRQNR